MEGPEVAVDCLPFFRGAQFAVDATIVSTLRGDGTARRDVAEVDGVVDCCKAMEGDSQKSWFRGQGAVGGLGIEASRRWSDEAEPGYQGEVPPRGVVDAQAGRAKHVEQVGNPLWPARWHVLSHSPCWNPFGSRARTQVWRRGVAAFFNLKDQLGVLV